jgi:deazaflavin-dependent oxidoreductase (nitroreductase family)
MTDSQPTVFGDEHVRQYRESNGEQGYAWPNGAKILILTTTGRKSGEKRDAPLIFQPNGDSYVIVASKGGAPEHPAWYVNLKADPSVQVQVKDKVFDATARVAAGDERTRLWKLMAEVWPDYDNYATKTDREIPVVVLDPA